jgi:hypothetical protein
MNPGRRSIAGWATGPRLDGGDNDKNQVTNSSDLSQQQLGRLWKECLQMAGKGRHLQPRIKHFFSGMLWSFLDDQSTIKFAEEPKYSCQKHAPDPYSRRPSEPEE